MIFFYILILLFIVLFLLSKTGMKISKHRFILFWIFLISLLSLVAFQFQNNDAQNFDTYRHMHLLNSFRYGGINTLKTYLSQTRIDKGRFILFYLLSLCSDDRLLQVIGVIVVYGCLGYLIIGIQKTEFKTKKISLAYLFPSMIFFQMYCDYAYRVVTEFRNAFAIAILSIGIYFFYYKKNLVVAFILVFVAVEIHLSCLFIVIYCLIAEFSNAHRFMKWFKWTLCFWQLVVMLFSNIMLQIPIGVISQLGHKIVLYTEFNERRHWLLWLCLEVSLLILAILIERLIESERNVQLRKLLTVLQLTTLMCFGGYNTVVATRYPMFIAFFGQLIIIKSLKNVELRRKMKLTEVLCRSELLMAIPLIFYNIALITVSVHYDGAVWLW